MKHKKYYSACGTVKDGFRIGIPMSAYVGAGKPEKYEVCVLNSGQLIYTPVRS